MYQFKATDSISKKVSTIVQSHVEARGAAWLLALNYGECNDYAANVCAIIQCRFETGARVIRSIKAKLRAAQPK